MGSTVTAVEAQGKHLLIDFSNGLTLHTHLRMHGSWHRYRPWETWKRPADRAVAVIGTPNSVAVCFDAPTVELLETRAVALHPQLSTLGPRPAGARAGPGPGDRQPRAARAGRDARRGGAAGPVAAGRAGQRLPQRGALAGVGIPVRAAGPGGGGYPP